LNEWVELVPLSEKSIRTVIPSEIKDQAIRMAESCFAGGNPILRPVIHLYGRSAAGKRSVAECLSQRIGLPLLVADVRRMPIAAAERADALWRFGRGRASSAGPGCGG